MAGGRKTKQEEIAEFLLDKGLSLDLLDEDAPDADELPETFKEMQDEWLKVLWRKRNSLSDTALTQGLKALAQLAQANKADDDEKTEVEPLVADVIAGVPGLPRERRDEILRRELTKLDVERARIEEVLADV